MAEMFTRNGELPRWQTTTAPFQRPLFRAIAANVTPSLVRSRAAIAPTGLERLIEEADRAGLTPVLIPAKGWLVRRANGLRPETRLSPG